MKSILYLMNTIWIVMPILVVLMFLLGMELSKKAFTDIARNPKVFIIRKKSISYGKERGCKEDV